MGTDEYKFWSDKLQELLAIAERDDYMHYLLHEQIVECYQNLIAILSN